MLLHKILHPFFLLLVIPLAILSNEEKFNNHFNKAKIATFYSSEYLNGFYELELAFTYLDSAKSELEKIPPTNPNKITYASQWNSLYNELNISKSIAVDNLNYIYPHYSIMAGYRDDFILIDEAEEILVEEVIMSHLNQTDPFFKGNLIDNTHFILFTLAPFDSTILGVCLDFIGSESSHYAIRPHEIVNILGDDGFYRYANNQLTKDDLSKILNHFKTDKIYNFHVKDNGSIIDNLFYKGCYLNIVDHNEVEPKFVKYYESFLIDKSQSFTNSVIIVTIVFVFFILFLIVGFEDSIKKVKSRFSIENLKADLIIVLSVIISIFTTTYVLSFLDPGINAFRGSLESKFWLLMNVLSPLVISFLSSFILTTKFSKAVTTDIRFRGKFIFAALSAPILGDVFYMNHAKIFFDYNLDFLAIPLLLILIYPSRLYGLLWHKISNKGEYTNGFIFISVLFIINYYISITYFEEHSQNLIFCFVAWIPLIVVGRIYAVRKKTDAQINELQLNTLSNPFQYIDKGFNVHDQDKELVKFMNSRVDFVGILKGQSGIGKSRFIEEFRKKNKENIELFYGDFDEFNEGAVQLYEPFFQAFCSHDNPNYCLDKGFFSDRSVTFNSISKVANLASSAAPIDLGDIISIDDNQGLSVNEISGELIEFLIDKLNQESEDKRLLIVLDDCQWADLATIELILSFVNKINNRGKSIASKIKLLLVVSDFQLNYENTSLNLKTLYDDLNNEMKEKIASFEISYSSPNKFLNMMFDDNGYNYFNEMDKVIFSPNFKLHIKDVVNENPENFTPKDLFSYIQALKNFNLLGIEGNLLRLIKYPDDDFTFKDSQQILMKSSYDLLDEDYKKIIESAAHVGVKFDASIIAYIWKRDLIQIINILEEIENVGLISDESSLDNIYSFKNKNFHKWLRSNHKKENNNEFKQKIIEFQKRIIDSVLSKGEDYISNLDIDILKSISNRCNLFSNIQEIEIHALNFNLITALKLVNLTKIKQSIAYLSHATKSFKYLKENQHQLLYDIVKKIQDVDRDLQKLDTVIKMDDGRETFLFNEIFNVLIKSSFRSKTILIFLLDSYRTSKKINEIKSKHSSDLTKMEKARLNLIDKISQLNHFIKEEDRLRADFYLTIIQSNDLVALNSLKKSAFVNSNFQLASEISRHLAHNLKSEKTIDQMFQNTIDSLYIDAGRAEELKEIDYESITFQNIHVIIKNLLSNTKISFKKAKNLSYTIGRLVEAFYIKKEYENVIKIGKLGIGLNKRIGEDIGLYIIWSYSGASNLFLNKIPAALKNFKNHFHHLLKNGADKEFFIGPIEGVLYCCKQNNDYTEFENIKNEMYEHLLFINNEMKENFIEKSLINKEVKLKDLIPIKEDIDQKSSYKEDTYSLSLDVFFILYCISKSDGSVEESELHDIIESVNAVTFAIGIKTNLDSSLIDKIKLKIDSIDKDKVKVFFKEKCDSIAAKHDENRLNSIYHFCEDIAMADGKIDQSEKELLVIAKKILVS